MGLKKAFFKLAEFNNQQNKIAEFGSILTILLQFSPNVLKTFKYLAHSKTELSKVGQKKL